MKIFKNIYVITLVLIFLVSFVYRYYGVITPHPFWVDEFATAAQAKIVQHYGLSVFTQHDYHFEYHNVTTHFVTALFFQLFGQSEQVARMPSVLFGSLVPVLIYLLIYQLFKNRPMALSASLLSIFSYIQITWSVQARSYMLQQVLLLLTLIIYFKWQKSGDKFLLLLLGLTAILGAITHTTYLLVLLGLIFHYLYLNRKDGIKILIKPVNFLLLTSLLLILILTGSLQNILEFLKSIFQTGLVNNLWYYHSFLWRQQTLTTFLGLLGLFLIWVKAPKKGLLLLLIVANYLIFTSFIFAPYVSRYLLPIFPLLFIGFGYSLSQVSKLPVLQKLPLWFKNSLPVLLALLIIFNGDKFVIKPKAFYSVNHDMREIALVDYDQVFAIIKVKGQLEKGETAVIDTWAPRAEWYLRDPVSIYWFRWINEPGLVNGIPKKTDYVTDVSGNKFIPRSGNPAMGFIGELTDLQKVMAKYKRGFIWIDDATLPADILSYAENNMYQELYLDHYRYDDNPYSIWPGTLYSWGITTVNPYFSSQNDLK